MAFRGGFFTGKFDGPPDGGWGWVVTAAVFTTHLLVLGTQYSFSILFNALVNPKP